MSLTYYATLLTIAFLASGLKIVKEYERGVRFTLGKYTGTMQPGLRLVIPIIQSWERVDIRTKVVDVPDQDCITKDNVSVNVNAVLYYKIKEKSAERAVLQVENFDWAVSQLAQTTMRDIVGEVTLDELLSSREKISKKILQVVDKATDAWAIDVESVDLKHIELPQDLKRVIGKEAEAEREKRAVIIKAEGEVIAATNMAKAAKVMSAADGALHLRTLQTLNDLSSDQSNTVIFAMPIEVLRAFEGMTKKNKK
ncbi:slipin family protein [Candidatus Woesearchaeota archaeon]|nr:MAG: slipin family protein [Candidatus Woesearchaeota archaeon]